MLIIDFVLCTASLGAAALSFWTKRPLYTVAISYVCFALSPIMDLLDILARAGKDDTAGILDIYPTFFKGYIVLLTMLRYGKEASNRKQEIDRQHYTIPNQRPKDKHCGKI